MNTVDGEKLTCFWRSPKHSISISEIFLGNSISSVVRTMVESTLAILYIMCKTCMIYRWTINIQLYYHAWTAFQRSRNTGQLIWKLFVFKSSYIAKFAKPLRHDVMASTVSFCTMYNFASLRTHYMWDPRILSHSTSVFLMIFRSIFFIVSKLCELIENLLPYNYQPIKNCSIKIMKKKTQKKV